MWVVVQRTNAVGTVDTCHNWWSLESAVGCKNFSGLTGSKRGSCVCFVLFPTLQPNTLKLGSMSSRLRNLKIFCLSCVSEVMRVLTEPCPMGSGHLASRLASVPEEPIKRLRSMDWEDATSACQSSKA